MTDDAIIETLERQTISLGTVIKWAAALISATVVVTGALIKIDALRDEQTRLQIMDERLEQRIHNIEEHVIWQHE